MIFSSIFPSDLRIRNPSLNRVTAARKAGPSFFARAFSRTLISGGRVAVKDPVCRGESAVGVADLELGAERKAEKEEVDDAV